MDRVSLDVPSRFESERFVLRAYQAGDGAMYYAAGVRNREHLARYEAVNVLLTPKSEADAEELVRELAGEWAARRSFFVGIFAKASGAWVGQLYIGVVNWDTPEFELGYVVDREHEGEGVIAESVNAALTFIFQHLQAHRVSLRCDDTNERSYRVAERAGFVREGHVRQDHRQADGTFTGTYVYGLLASEFGRGKDA
jgi:RimJ/RimL family protein N-acetyltransferase